MAHNDKLNALGILVYFITPLIMLLLAFLINDVLIPYLINVVNGLLNTKLDSMSTICNMCELMRVNNITIPDCKGFDAWGFSNLCSVVTVAQG